MSKSYMDMQSISTKNLVTRPNNWVVCKLEALDMNKKETKHIKKTKYI